MLNNGKAGLANSMVYESGSAEAGPRLFRQSYSGLNGQVDRLPTFLTGFGGGVGKDSGGCC